ncbi:adenosylcobinamide-phosphate synthase CbiB [Desulfobacula sp.]|uniref:Cobalamin biosynthesis protein CobD n=1 Tax=Candidatus Desulfatibia vada TaxID=2841696 RepID=A0A8J6P0M8_9BACT|nr:cobalamin biosynthesis protein CobD [Candidatus Desulfatibia vada]MBL6994147.1 cobalamin biosynthesis protein CobD [Desulfobacula sp.]
MDFTIALYALPAAFLLDLVLGDPESLPHPIRWMGKSITFMEPIFRKLPTGPAISGAFLSISLIATTWALTSLVIQASELIHPLAGDVLEILIIYYAVSARSLEDSALEIYRSLQQNRLQEAKARVAMIVGRDVADLKEDGIARATVETVGENLVDGVVSPLFYAAIGGAPLAMAYKMVNTLDSMIGYKNDTYRHFGKIAARIDDVANFIPARLVVAVIAIAALILIRRGRHTWETAMAEGANHSSPNAGYPEAAFAGALSVQLGGPGYYEGHLVKKPYIGLRFGQTKPIHIKRACDLMMLSALIWLGILCAIMIIL